LTVCDDATHAGRPPVSARRDEEFTQYVSAHLAGFRRLAFLLCQDWHRADDLVQGAITRLYVQWGQASAVDHTDAYARTILVREFLREQRSGWARQQRAATGDGRARQRADRVPQRAPARPGPR
jgi:DNA-directed RNA polymerase specialized sigma24 family protein